MSDLDKFMKGMDGEWKIIRIEHSADGTRVTYQSLTFDDLTWSHRLFRPGTAKVGDVGRIGWVSNSTR